MNTETEIQPPPSAQQKLLEIFYVIFSIVSVLSFVMCLALPGFVVGGNLSYSGLAALFYGPLGLLVAFKTHWPWLANPVLFAAWLFLYLRAKETAGICACAAVLAAGYFWAFPRIMHNEGGAVGTVPLGLGYWFWLISTLCAFAAAQIGLNMDEPVSGEPD